MIASLTFGLLLVAQAAPAAPVAAPPPPATTPPVTVTAPPPAAPITPTELEQLHDMYRVTCEAREYGAYDDMCDQLNQQVRAAEREAARAARRHPKPAAPTPQP